MYYNYIAFDSFKFQVQYISICIVIVSHRFRSSIFILHTRLYSCRVQTKLSKRKTLRQELEILALHMKMHT